MRERREGLFSDFLVLVAEKELRVLQATVQNLSQEREELRASRDVQLQKLTETRLELEDASRNATVDKEAQKRREQEVVAIDKQLKEAEKKLAVCEKDLDKAKEAEGATAAKLRETQTRLDELLEREARATQFKSKKERDQHLKAQSKQLDIVISSQKEQLNAVEKEIADLRNQVNALNAQREKAQKDFDKHRKTVQTATQRLGEARIKRDESANKRKELWREEEKIRTTVCEEEFGWRFVTIFVCLFV